MNIPKDWFSNFIFSYPFVFRFISSCGGKYNWNNTFVLVISTIFITGT
ncbi:MAG: hypothetical protein WCG25_07620 [bacterium]